MMLKAIFNWFTGKPVPGTEAPAVKAESAPYKVEPPPVVKVSEPVRVEAVEPAPKPKRAPAVKKPAAPRAPAKPRAKKTPAQ